MDVNKIVNNLGRLKSERSNIDSIWDYIDNYVVPFRSDIYNEGETENSVDWRNRTLYDATAADANETLSSVIHGSITSTSVKFFSMQFRQEMLNEEEEAVAWIQECEDIVFQTLQDSNFDVESSEFYIDLTSYGTAIIIEEGGNPIDFDGVDFFCAPIAECYFDQDHKGNIVNFYRELDWTPIQIIEKFGEENVPQTIIDRKDHSDVKIKVVFSIYKRDGKRDATKEVAPEDRQFGFKYVIIADKAQLGKTGGYYEMPAFVARWRKTSRSKWGFSPAFIALSDILSLNQVVEDTFEALGKVIDPATLTTERGLISDLDLGRAGLTVVKDIDDIKSYESKARFDVGELKIDRLQMSINRAFKIDKIQMKENVEMTAEEFRGRWEMLHRMLGPTAGRLQNDFLDPLLERTFNMLYRANKLPEMPQIVKDNEGVMNIEYVGPMARAQKKIVVQSILEWLGSIGQVAEAFPEVMDIPDMDKITRDTGILSGVPIKYMKNAGDVKKLRDQRQAKATEAAATEQAKAAGDAKKAQGDGDLAMGEAASV